MGWKRSNRRDVPFIATLCIWRVYESANGDTREPELVRRTKPWQSVLARCVQSIRVLSSI